MSSLLIRNLARLSSSGGAQLTLIRPYSEVVNVFGRRTVDTEKKQTKVAPAKAAPISESIERVGDLSAHPKEHLDGRVATIFSPVKHAMQSGTNQTRKWRIVFDNRERWENPNMGWGSTGDPLSNMTLEFGTKEDAEVYCQRMGIKYEVDTPHVLAKRIKSYGANFSWNKRTRRTAK